MKMYNGKGFHN